MTIETKTPATTTRSGAYVVPREGGEPLWHLGGLNVLKATGAETAGQLWVMEQTFRRGPGAPMHVHHHEDEAWFVLEGRFTVVVGDQVHTLEQGDFAWGPRDVAHGFAVDTPTGRCLTLATPAGFEHFFRQTGEPAGALDLPPAPLGPPSQAQVDGLARALVTYGVDLLGPPPEPATAG